MTMLSGGMVDGCFKYFVFRASDGKAAVFSLLGYSRQSMTFRCDAMRLTMDGCLEDSRLEYVLQED